ncbi:diacylglycerol/lipid kinase family protein [Miniphocaeibacter massiliensis]|uniref:diacylglycerol/lipid kinase family protein n=1 Tax=Miniphocaeibacter massiliensis TaxID=2041841 RepID=UPI0013ED066B|nr:YegS/Rv2252/BmrU family lipid kinase [Miniphocaeibacter massiliensis]
MRKIKIIYNPTSGSQGNKKTIDNISCKLLDKGYLIQKVYTTGQNSAYEETIKADKDGFDIVIACGGDGTVNEVVNGLVKVKSNMKLGIFPLGTVNDFAYYLGLDTSSKTLTELIEEDEFINVDIGIAGEKNFINVAAGGLLANVGHETAKGSKAMFGRLAYVAEGIRIIPDIITNDFNLKYKIDDKEYEDNVYLFLIANSSSIGGFKKAAPNASVSDGYLDCVIIKSLDKITDLAQVFLQVLSGGHINNDDVRYFHAKKIEMTSDSSIEVDVDGEYAGELPMEFKLSDYKAKVFANSKE